MQNKLENKVQSLRSQGLKFEKDGFDFTLDVPDTGDVKAIFGTMVETIVTQEKHIVDLVETLEKTNADFKKTHTELVNWAKESIAQLNAKNELLFENLLDARSKIKNFSFNIQGFEDKNEVDDFSNKMKKINLTKPKVPIQQKQEEELYFPTEDGAPLKNNLDVVDKSLKRKKSKKDNPSAMLDQMTQDKKVEIKGISNFTPIQKWQWACRQIIRKERISKLGFSLTRTRMNKSSSVLDRLERIEQRLFYMPMEVTDKVAQLEEILTQKISSDIAKIEEKHLDVALKTMENFNNLEQKYDNLHNTVQKLELNLENLRDELKAILHNETLKLQQNIHEIQQLREQDLKLQNNTLHDKLVTLTSAFKTIELGVGKVSRDVGSMIKSNDSNYKKADDTVAILLKSDTNMRIMRETLTRFESDIFTLHTLASTLKQEAATILGSTAGEILSRIEDVITEGMGEVELNIEQTKEQIHKHDEVISERWATLTNINKSMKDIKNVSEKIEKLQAELDNKISSSEIDEILRDFVPHTSQSENNTQPIHNINEVNNSNNNNNNNNTTKTSTSRRPTEVIDHNLKEKVDLLTLSLKDLTQRIDQLSSQSSDNNNNNSNNSTFRTRSPSNIQFNPAPQQYNSSTLESSQIQAVSALVSGESKWNNAEFEAQLQPLVKDIVNMYLANWQESQQYDHDDYYQEDYYQDDYPNTDRRQQNINENKNDVEDIGLSQSEIDEVMQDFGGAAQSPGNSESSPKPNKIKNNNSSNNNNNQQSKSKSQREKIKEDLDDDIEDNDELGGDENISPRSTTSIHRQSHNNSSSHKTRKSDISNERKRDNGNNSNNNNGNINNNDDELTIDKVKRSISNGTTNNGNNNIDVIDENSTPLPRLKPSFEPPPLIKRMTNKSRDMDDPSRPRLRPLGQTIDPTEINRLKSDIKELQEKFDKFSRGMIDKESLKALLNQKADAKILEKKVDVKVLETIETTVKDCMSEIGDLKSLREEELSKLKSGIEKKIKSSLKSLLQSNLDDIKGANASTQSLCLSCGQPSQVRVSSSQTSAPSFLPSLNSHSTTGPEVLRAGFRMPVSNPSNNLLLGNSLIIGSNFSQLSADDSFVTDVDAPISIDLESKSKSKPKNDKRQKTAPQGPSSNYIEESTCARSIFKKGFPGKKSNRAVAAYAPDRYSLPTDPMSRSAPLIAPIIPRAKVSS